MAATATDAALDTAVRRALTMSRTLWTEVKRAAAEAVDRDDR